MRILYNEPGLNGRGSTPQVREIYSRIGDKNMEMMGKRLGIFINETPLLGGDKDNVDRYKQLVESVWIPEKVELRDYYSTGERLMVGAAPILGAKAKQKALDIADKSAMGKAKVHYKKKLIDGIDEIIGFCVGLVENCNLKIAEVTNERDTAYEKTHVSESLALKEVEYVDAFEERKSKLKKDTKALVEADERRKVCDCEKIIYDLELNIESSKRKARHYAKQNELQTKKGVGCKDRITHLRFLKGRYLSIVTQADLMLTQLNSNEFNLENCLVKADQLKEHNSLMEESESVMTKQEEAQEGSLELAFDNFGFAEEYSGSPTWRETAARAEAQDNKETISEMESMEQRRKKRLEDLLDS